MSENDPIYCIDGHECSYNEHCPGWKIKSCALQALFMLLKGKDYTTTAKGVDNLAFSAPISGESAPLQDALKGYLNLLDISSDTKIIKPIKFTDQWTNINMIMKAFGYEWKKDASNSKNNHWEFTGKTETVPTPVTQPTEGTRAGFTNCKDVVVGMKSFKIHGKLLDDPVEQELKTKKGPMTVVKTRIDDGTSPLRITFWNPSKVPILKAGDEVTVDGLLGSAPYDGLPQASGGDYVKIIFEK
jgi:hypothetical protein